MNKVIYFVNDENTYIQDGVVDTQGNYYYRNNTYCADCSHGPLIYTCINIIKYIKIIELNMHRIGGQKTRKTL